MSKKDYYDVLGVSRDADEATLKKSFRRLAMKYHPDRNPDDKGAEEKFKEAKEAYEVLSNPEKRQAYNQFGHAGVQQGAGHGGFSGGASPFGDIFEDIFGDIFGGGARRHHAGGRRGPIPERGADLRYNLELTLEDAVFGKQVNINVPTYVGCEPCSGSGAKKGSTPVTCNTCQGAGQVRMQQGFFTVQQTCPACHGGGQMIKDPCTNCAGQGRVKETRTLSVKIPPGVDTGDRVRLHQKGEAGTHGGPAGDLYVQVNIREHELFNRDGEDLYCTVPISFVIAALGGEIEVPTLEGRVKLKVPPESQSGKIFRLRGKGVPRVKGGGSGDLLCEFHVETPVNLNAEQKEILKKFDDSMAKNDKIHSPNTTTWINKVKSFIERIGKN